GASLPVSEGAAAATECRNRAGAPAPVGAEERRRTQVSTRTIRGTARGVIAGTLGAALATAGLAVAAGPAAAAPEEDTSTATGAAPADASDFAETVLPEEIGRAHV